MFKRGALYTRLQISKAMCLLWGIQCTPSEFVPVKIRENDCERKSVHLAEESEEATQSVPVQQGNTCLYIRETVLMQTALKEVSNTSST